MATKWQIGEKIENRWEICDIMRGGMDVVYIVYDHQSREPFAIKTFSGKVYPRTVERFTIEALLWVNLDAHPNVTQARFVKNIEGRPCLFLEYVSGGHLGRWIRTPQLRQNLPQLFGFAIGICDGMTHAFSKGLQAHRDIKPENCLISADNTLKITDFGMARIADIAEEEGIRGGTIEFMAPEQWDNFELADERADIYSFGATLYRMLTGEYPFGDSTEVSVREMERRHKEDTPVPLAPQFHELSAFVSKCLAKNPTERFPTFVEARAALASLCESMTGESAPQPVTGAAFDAGQWSEKGGSLRALGRYEEALECYERALELDGDLADVWSNKGEALWSLGRIPQALECLERALDLNPEGGEIWSNRAAILTQCGQAEAALECCARALELNPNLAMAWNNRGVALMALGQVEASLECYDRALELDPYLENAWSNKGSALGALERAEEELQHYNRALELNWRLDQTWCNKGSVLASRGEWNEAIKCYDRALKLNPQHADSWFNKGDALQSSGRVQKSVACYERALNLNPGDTEAWNRKGSALLQLGRTRKAVEAFECALQIAPGDVEAANNQANALEKMGHTRKARAAREQAGRSQQPRPA